MNDPLPESDGHSTPRHLTKQQFGKRLFDHMMQRGWNQSELARQADLPRDSISVYVRGRSFPTPKSLQKLANAFGVQPQDLLPNSREMAIDEDHPSLEMRVSPHSPMRAWLRVNREVSFETATKVMELIQREGREDAA